MGINMGHGIGILLLEGRCWCLFLLCHESLASLGLMEQGGMGCLSGIGVVNQVTCTICTV